MSESSQSPAVVHDGFTDRAYSWSFTRWRAIHSRLIGATVTRSVLRRRCGLPLSARNAAANLFNVETKPVHVALKLRHPLSELGHGRRHGEHTSKKRQHLHHSAVKCPPPPRPPPGGAREVISDDSLEGARDVAPLYPCGNETFFVKRQRQLSRGGGAVVSQCCSRFEVNRVSEPTAPDPAHRLPQPAETAEDQGVSDQGEGTALLVPAVTRWCNWVAAAAVTARGVELRLLLAGPVDRRDVRAVAARDPVEVGRGRVERRVQLAEVRTQAASSSARAGRVVPQAMNREASFSVLLKIVTLCPGVRIRPARFHSVRRREYPSTPAATEKRSTDCPPITASALPTVWFGGRTPNTPVPSTGCRVSRQLTGEIPPPVAAASIVRCTTSAVGFVTMPMPFTTTIALELAGFASCIRPRFAGAAAIGTMPVDQARSRFRNQVSGGSSSRNSPGGMNSTSSPRKRAISSAKRGACSKPASATTSAPRSRSRSPWARRRALHRWR